jgi:small subunit ribosomal protein S14
MARTALVLRQLRFVKDRLTAKTLTPEKRAKKRIFQTRAYNRCSLCQRRRGFMRFFGICRICFRELAANGDIPGVKKSSW